MKLSMKETGMAAIFNMNFRLTNKISFIFISLNFYSEKFIILELHKILN